MRRCLDLRGLQAAGLVYVVLGVIGGLPGVQVAFISIGIIAGIIGALGTVASAAASGYSMYSARKNAQAQAEAAEQEARYRAKQAENAAEQERLNRLAQERDERQAVRRRRASMEARYAKAGVLLTGTPSDFLGEQAATDELNIQRANQRSAVRQRSLLHGGQVALTTGANVSDANQGAGRQQVIGAGLSGVARLGQQVSLLDMPNTGAGSNTGQGTALAEPGAVMSALEQPAAGLSLGRQNWAADSDYYYDISTGF